LVKAVNTHILDALTVVEEVRKLVKNLERINIPGTMQVREVWDPRRKDLKPKVFNRLHPQITIELSKGSLTKKHIGYQAYRDEPVNQDYNRERPRRYRNRSRDNRDNKADRENRNERKDHDDFDDREYR